MKSLIMKPRQSTKYWDLKTGSHIAYTFVPAKGNEKKPYPVIYLHGGPGGYVYSKNIEVLSELSNNGFDVYFYDQIGCGLSARLKDITQYTAEKHKKDLEEIVKVIGAKKVIFICQSWGGTLATLYVADHSDKVEKLIFTNPGPIKPEIIKNPKNNFPDSLHLRQPYDPNKKANLMAISPRTISIGLWANVIGKKLASDKEMDGFLTSLAQEFTKGLVCDSTKILKEEGGAGGYCSICTNNSFKKLEDPRPKLIGNNIPVLFLKGQCDNIEWEYNQEYFKYYKNLKFVLIKDAGHQIFVEQPKQYVDEILKFIN